MMALCCIIPIMAVLVLSFLGIQNSFTAWLALIACPLAMMAMMHMHSKKKCQ
jgi:hypothetical protein